MSRYIAYYAECHYAECRYAECCGAPLVGCCRKTPKKEFSDFQIKNMFFTFSLLQCYFIGISERTVKSISSHFIEHLIHKLMYFGIKAHIFPAPVFPRVLPFITIVTLFHLCAPAFVKATF